VTSCNVLICSTYRELISLRCDFSEGFTHAA
jgi:hypothetical protein